jgi:beta-glucosidase
MRRHPAYQPLLTELEPRIVPTTGAYPDLVRTAIHDAYVAQAQQAPTPVVFLGDSITYLWGTSSYNWGPASRLGTGVAAWNADIAALGASNFGIPGDQTQNLLYRVENGELDGTPKLAVVMIGINDLLGGRTPNETAAGVASVVSTIRAESPGTEVLLLGILPTASTALNAEVGQTNALIARMSQEPGIAFLNPGADFYTSSGTVNTSLLADGVHPSPAGYAVIGSAIEGSLVTSLQEGITPGAGTAKSTGNTPAARSTPTPSPAVTSISILTSDLIPLDPTSSVVSPSTTSTSNSTHHAPSAVSPTLGTAAP